MQTAAAKPGASAKALGCYKCGKTGHWSRDCTAPPSEWVERAPGATGVTAAGQAAVTAENEPASDPAVALGAAEAAKARRKRPKVTLELLKQPSGLPDVYHNFPTICAQQFRGPGHEVADLRRLLEMYKRWQDRIFPGAEYDRFVVDVEKLSGSNVLKHELQDMRMSLLKAAQDVAAPPMARDDDDAGGAHAAAELEDDLMLDDDELMELVLGCEGGGVGADRGAAAAPLGGDDDSDDLLELAEFEGDEEPLPMLAPTLAQAECAEDDELLALALGVEGSQPWQPACEEASTRSRAQPDSEATAAVGAEAPAGEERGAGGAAAGAVLAEEEAHLDEDDDDELLRLALGGSQA